MRRTMPAALALAIAAAFHLAAAAPSEAQNCNGRTLTNQGTITPTTTSQTVSGSVTSSVGAYYQVNVYQAGTYTFTFCAPGSSTYDSYLCLLDTSFTLIVSNDDWCGLQSQISRALTTGRYFIGVSGFGSSSGSYTLAYSSSVANGPPAAPIVATPLPPNGGWTSSATPTLSAVVVGSSGSSSVHAEFSVDGGPFTDGTVVSDFQTSTWVSPSLSDGAHTWQVRAQDNLGLTSPTTLTQTLNVDTSAPLAGTVHDGTAADVDWQTTQNSISANWSGFSDPQSSLTYAWAIGTTPGGTNVRAYVSVGAATSATATVTLTGNGPFFVSVRATNAAGLQTIATSDGVTVLTTANAAALVDASVGQAYSATLTASFGTGPYTWALEAGLPPSGLTLATDGSITGTPSGSGMFVFGVSAQDSLGAVRRFSYKILLQPSGGSGPVILSGNSTGPTALPSSQIFFSYSYTLTASGGQSPYVWRIASGSLPQGLILDSLTGVISGFTSGRVGTFTFTVAATDVNEPSQEATAILSITITGTAPALFITTPASLPSANTNAPYATILSHTGGTSPYAWSVSSGTLPAGLTLDPDGTISGTPTTAGPGSFTLTVTDAASVTANLAATLNIAAGTGPLQIEPATLPLAAQGLAYPVTFTATGGTVGYAWNVASGALPPGMTLDGATGTLTGAPTASGRYRFVVRAVDSGTPVSEAFVVREINVLRTSSAGYVIVTPSPLPAGSVGTAYSTSMAVVGGTAPHAWSMFSGSLPPGLTLNANTGEISGSPTAAGTYGFAVEASSSGAILSSVRLYSLAVSGPAAGGGGGGGGGGCGLLGLEPAAVLFLISLGFRLRRRRLTAGT